MEDTTYDLRLDPEGMKPVAFCLSDMTVEE